jgi:hypothetical protein
MREPTNEAGLLYARTAVRTYYSVRLMLYAPTAVPVYDTGRM